MIAAEARVHKATVSLALRNDPKLPETTRNRIQAIAQELGYAPNPLVSMLMSRVRRRDVRYRGTLAYLHTVPRGDPRLEETVHRNYLAGAKARAAELGYHLDEFFLDGDGMTGERVRRLLGARGVAGLVIEHTPSAFCPSRNLPFDCARLAAVAIGTPLGTPRLHYVANDQYMRAIIAARELLALGYRRLGLVLSDIRFDSAMAHRCSAGFWAVQSYVSEIPRIPILRLGGKADAAALSAWRRRHRPDVILGTHEKVCRLLRAGGARVPDTVGWAHLDWLPPFAPMAGVHGNSARTGSAAVDVIVSQVHRGESGPPANAMNHFVSGSWIPGDTVRRVGPPLDLESSFFADLAGA